MKKYISPIITAVKLDPKQAVLATCAVDGIYMKGPTVCISGGITLVYCRTPIKGHGTGLKGWDTEAGVAPS